MDNKGLLFIPDISGFTRFLNETEIEHSKHIIEELLDVIIGANEIDLKISEIEGDAILFYKFGDAPSLHELQGQVEKMFMAFHQQLKNYENRRICQCGACCTAINLTLKFIIHYGEFTGYQIKDFYQLLGKEVILVHQLMKNDIPGHEYWMITENISGSHDLNQHPVPWHKGEKKIDEVNVSYHYSVLSHLKEKITADPVPDLNMDDNKIKALGVTNDVETGMFSLLEILTDLSLRSSFVVGLKNIDNESHKINQLCNKHRCILKNGSSELVTSGIDIKDNRVVFTETDVKKNHSLQYTLDKIDENTTRLTVELYLKKKFLSQYVFPLLMKKKYVREFEETNNRLIRLIAQKKQ